MATKTQPAGLPAAREGRPPLRNTPRGMSYSQGRQHTPAPAPAAGQRTRASGGASRPSGGSSRRRGTVRQFAAPEFREYQGIVLAEFVAAELLVAATPIATRQNVPGLSPYIPRDLTKMLAIGLLYFILELLAVGGGKMARLSAWFGGLILLTVGLNESANIAKDLDIFGAQPKAKSGASNGS